MAGCGNFKGWKRFSCAHALLDRSGHVTISTRRLGTTQSAVARLEGGRESPSFATLRGYAKATGTRLGVELVPPGG